MRTHTAHHALAAAYDLASHEKSKVHRAALEHAATRQGSLHGAGTVPQGSGSKFTSRFEKNIVGTPSNHVRS